MRIISGKFKGHKLKAFQASHIRPTTDRVKESVFNKLAGDIADARVLDLYSGTGNLSFESLSRGADFVMAVEKSAKSLRIIEENRKHLKVTEDFQVRKADVFKFLKGYVGDPFDVILIDPPFTLKIADKTMQELVNSCVLGDDSIIMIESSRHEPISDAYDGLELWDRKDFGDKVVSFYLTQTKENPNG